jgi:hypothetical protein
MSSHPFGCSALTRGALVQLSGNVSRRAGVPAMPLVRRLVQVPALPRADAKEGA